MKPGTFWRKEAASVRTSEGPPPVCGAQARYAALIASLPERTGRDLASWMGLLSKAEFRDKNEAIDYLRVRGLSFAEASMLERTHARGHSPFAPREPVSRRVTDSPPTGVRLASTPEPAPTFPVWRSPEEHASRLVAYLQERNWRTGEVLSREIQTAYNAMCDHLGWHRIGWRAVGATFRQLIGDRKHYRDFIVQGRRHRWCVFTLPVHGASEARERLDDDGALALVAAAA